MIDYAAIAISVYIQRLTRRTSVLAKKETWVENYWNSMDHQSSSYVRRFRFQYAMKKNNVLVYNFVRKCLHSVHRLFRN